MTDPEIRSLFNPWVMRCAWRKVQSWYRSGEWCDPAEYLDWRSDPWRHLSGLADELAEAVRKGEGYMPGRFPLVPYPKKGNRTRHYTVPSVRDQVAFSVFSVLLGPFLEARMPNVSMGNRLFRARVRRSTHENNITDDNENYAEFKWYRAPYSLSHDKMYDSFSVGYGLFRRLLQWAVNETVLPGSAIPDDPADYESPDVLPYRSKKMRLATQPKDVYCIRFDVETAYPAISRDFVSDSLRQLVSCSTGVGPPPTKLRWDDVWGLPQFPSLSIDWKYWYAPFESLLERDRESIGGTSPWTILSEDDDLRTRLATSLGKSLQNVEYVPWPQPAGWPSFDMTNEQDYRPENCDSHGLWPRDSMLSPEQLKSNCHGLPTGLAISGLLMNVAMTEFDRQACRRIEAAVEENEQEETKQTENKQCYAPFFYYRFVDDIILLSTSPKTIREEFQRLRSNLDDLGLKVNWRKAEPRSLGEFLREEESDEKNDDKVTQSKEPRFPLRHERLDRGKLRHFSTDVVREMSELADESLDERYGALNWERIESLLDLAERESDEEVPGDARLSYAINRLARAAWPKEPILSDGREISPEGVVQRIKLGAERALRNHPWRFKLWSAVIIISMRIFIGSSNSSDLRKQTAWEWLGDLLKLIAWDGEWEEHPILQPDDDAACEFDGTERESDRCKSSDCPDCVYCKETNERRYQNRCLRTSFHRATFWRALARHIRILQLIANDQYEYEPQLGAWTFHIKPDDAKSILETLADWDQWRKIIYPDFEDGEQPKMWRGHGPVVWWWEVEALNDSLLACTDVSSCESLLEELGSPRQGATRRLLSFPELQKGELLHSAVDNALGVASLPTHHDQGRKALWLSQMPRPDSDSNGLPGDTLDRILPDIEDEEEDVLFWASMARLDLWPELHEQVKAKLPAVLPRPRIAGPDSWPKVMLIDCYAALRRLMLAHGLDVYCRYFQAWFPRLIKEQGQKANNSLLEAMYAFASNSAPSEAVVSALPLPHQVAEIVIEAALENAKKNSTMVFPGAVVLTDDAFDRMAKFRQLTTSVVDRHAAQFSEEASGLINCVKNSNDTIATATTLTPDDRAPHPVFFQAILMANQTHRVEWSAALTYLWSITGGEQILNDIYNKAPWHIPLTERDWIRDRLFLPHRLWKIIEKRLGLPPQDANALTYWVQNRDGMAQDIHLPKPLSTATHTDSNNELRVRIVQGKECLSPKKWAGLKIKGHSDRQHFDASLTEIAENLRELRLVASSSERPILAVFPEYYVPQFAVRHLRQFVRETGVSIIAGLTPVELPRVVPTIRALSKTGKRLWVNEAVLITPEIDESDYRRIRCWHLRKRYPNHDELRLALSMSDQSNGQQEWSVVPGLMWQRFKHPTWGNFAIAICSDLFDMEVMEWLKGRIHHLFVVAMNRDVDLFDQLTWTRGYELFVNIVSVNHGKHGGSVAWAPQRAKDKEVFRVHGTDQRIATTIKLINWKEIESQHKVGFLVRTIEHASDKKDDHEPQRTKTPSPTLRKRD